MLAFSVDGSEARGSSAQDRQEMHGSSFGFAARVFSWCMHKFHACFEKIFIGYPVYKFFEFTAYLSENRASLILLTASLLCSPTTPRTTGSAIHDHADYEHLIRHHILARQDVQEAITQRRLIQDGVFSAVGE
ncbi:hypothetical protein AKJ16_DCAP27233 [Drosera capensis]